MNKFIEANKKLWNNWAKSHFSGNANGYDLESFKAGKGCLNKIELEELGNVKGKSLLHLQCHFGMDTLSWAWEGASVTGVDFSEEAIQIAKKLSEELNISSRFICSNIYELPNCLDEKFDIVFTSYGVLPWLPDLNKWAKVITNYLKPGGIFYIAEFHPFIYMFSEDFTKLNQPYFNDKEPVCTLEVGSYANRAGLTQVAYEWPRPIGEVITALRRVGVILDFIHEFPYSVHNCYPNLEEKTPGEYTVKGYAHPLPLMYSIKATYMPQLAQ